MAVKPESPFVAIEKTLEQLLATAKDGINTVEQMDGDLQAKLTRRETMMELVAKLEPARDVAKRGRLAETPPNAAGK